MAGRHRQAQHKPIAQMTDDARNADGIAGGHNRSSGTEPGHGMNSRLAHGAFA